MAYGIIRAGQFTDIRSYRSYSAMPGIRPAIEHLAAAYANGAPKKGIESILSALPQHLQKPIDAVVKAEVSAETQRPARRLLDANTTQNLNRLYDKIPLRFRSRVKNTVKQEILRTQPKREYRHAARMRQHTGHTIEMRETAAYLQFQLSKGEAYRQPGTALQESVKRSEGRVLIRLDAMQMDVMAQKEEGRRHKELSARQVQYTETRITRQIRMKNTGPRVETQSPSEGIISATRRFRRGSLKPLS